MKKRAHPLLAVVFLIAGFTARGQTDTTFWFAAPEISQSFGNFDRPIVFRISALGQSASITLSMPANAAFTPITTTVPASGIATIDVTPWIDLIESKPPNTVLNSGLKLSSTARVNVYYENISGLNQSCQCNPEIFVLKGKNALGTDFLVPSQNVLQNGTAYSPPALNSFDIVATENGTNVTIIPKVAIVGHAGGVPFTITLNKGQVFSCTSTGPFAFNHLTGSRVTSTKPVAITVKDDLLQGPACWDLGGDQIIPVDNLSTEYIAVRGYLASLTDQVFISAISSGTSVSVNGAPLTTLAAGQTVVIPFTDEAMYIQSNNKIYAFQLSGFGCEVGLSTLPSIVCRGSNSVSFARSSSADLILMMITKSGIQNSFLLNGAPLLGAVFNPVPGTSSQWLYARVTIPVSQIPALGSGILTNSAGRFHLGIIHGSTTSGGSRFGYFSDFASPVLNVLPDSLKMCSDSILLNAGTGYATYAWNNGSILPSITAGKNGMYKVTVTTNEGCTLSDSGYVKLDKLIRHDSVDAFVCTGQAYTLPWGTAVFSTGIYCDTLHYLSGCDSIRRTINLKQLSSAVQTTAATICAGQSYTLPSGTVIRESGIYRDTLRATFGCDSIIRAVKVTVQPPAITTSVVGICSGLGYTLPWGQTVTAAGTYRDTLRYSSGCDSLIRSVSLTVQSAAISTSSALLCSGETYVLPWGATVNSPGIYQDTLRYTGGCDSLIRTVNLAARNTSVNTSFVTLCGGSYTLPWAQVVTNAGVYADTVKYVSGCDSLIKRVYVNVVKPNYNTLQITVCPGQSYSLPSGLTVKVPGIYRDTLRSNSGCDSIITNLTLVPGVPPAITIRKSNDIGCGLGISRLQATGGVQYLWWPASSLNNPFVANPAASPVASTVYHVKVSTADGCSAEDSIKVNANFNALAADFLVPSAFTPNGDGKNDCFGVSHWGAVKSFRVTIYNRFGQVIFTTTDVSKCWDGTFGGIPQNSSAFAYVISADTNCGKVFKQGTVVLIR